MFLLLLCLLFLLLLFLLLLLLFSLILLLPLLLLTPAAIPIPDSASSFITQKKSGYLDEDDAHCASPISSLSLLKSQFLNVSLIMSAHSELANDVLFLISKFNNAFITHELMNYSEKSGKDGILRSIDDDSINEFEAVQ
jgi:hypothetical protein